MLKENALHFFNANGKQCRAYEDSALLLRRRFNSCHKRSRILTKFKWMPISEEFARNTNRSQVEIFIDFTATMMQLQNQLNIPYLEDRFQRDQLVTAVEIRWIQTSLRDRIPRTSEQAVNRISNPLSEKRKTSGRTILNIKAEESSQDTLHDQTPDVLYYQGQSYNRN